jgi:hypothetical protein
VHGSYNCITERHFDEVSGVVPVLSLVSLGQENEAMETEFRRINPYKKKQNIILSENWDCRSDLVYFCRCRASSVLKVSTGNAKFLLRKGFFKNVLEKFLGGESSDTLDTREIGLQMQGRQRSS